jgi:histidine triad (HIT) family protein
MEWDRGLQPIILSYIMESCLFCKIASKEIAAKVVYEDGATIAFLDVAPHALGYTMAILKRHVPTMFELSDVELGQLFAAVRKTGNLLSQKFHPDGMTIGINQGKASGQEIDHLHAHLIPRWHNGGGGAIQSVVANSPKESLDKIAAK